MIKLVLSATACILLAWMFGSKDNFASPHQGRHIAARMQIANFQRALERYRSDAGAFPTEAEGLRALRVNPGKPGWRGPYFEVDIPNDPWGQPYDYRIIGGLPDITYRASRSR